LKSAVLQGGEMKRLVITLIILAFFVYYDTASAEGVTLHLDIGAAKVSGGLFEDTTHRMISGVRLFYTSTSYL